jgi:sorbin and SH3 domain-containing protein 1
LSFKKGDILLVRRRINDDWLEGESQGLIGIFPLNHVELFPNEAIQQEDYLNNSEKEYDAEGEAIVKYDFIPQKTFELQLRKVRNIII